MHNLLTTETHPSDQFLTIRTMLDDAHDATRQIAAGFELYAQQQRDRADRCDGLVARLAALEVSP